MNPCPCGLYGDSQKPCTRAVLAVTKYQKRISGPLLDRIDIHVEVSRVDYEKLNGDRVRGPVHRLHAYKQRVISKQNDIRVFEIRIPNDCVLSVTPTCTLGRSGNSAGFRPGLSQCLMRAPMSQRKTSLLYTSQWPKLMIGEKCSNRLSKSVKQIVMLVYPYSFWKQLFSISWDGGGGCFSTLIVLQSLCKFNKHTKLCFP